MCKVMSCSGKYTMMLNDIDLYHLLSCPFLLTSCYLYLLLHLLCHCGCRFSSLHLSRGFQGLPVCVPQRATVRNLGHQWFPGSTRIVVVWRFVRAGHQLDFVIPSYSLQYTCMLQYSTHIYYHLLQLTSQFPHHGPLTWPEIAGAIILCHESNDKAREG